MRRMILTMAVLACSLWSATAALAQRACVLDPEGYVVCGPLVQRGYDAPYRHYDRPRPYYDRRDGRDDRRDRRDYRGDNRRRAQPKCQRGYTVQGGVCKPYHAPPKCQKNYTVQDGVCKPYTGR